MTFDWMLSSTAQAGFLGAALIACLVVFLSIKLEVAKLRRSLNDSRNSAAITNAELEGELATMRKELLEAESRFAGAEGWTVSQELTPMRRAHALRLQDRGESPAAIAATLRVPRNEIELLMKVQRLTAPSPAGK
jgi:hypothetical protein